MAAPKPNEELITTDKNVLRFYRAFIAEHGSEPSYKQVGEGCALTVSGARYALMRLKDKGFLQDKKITQIRLTLSMKGRKVEL